MALSVSTNKQRYFVHCFQATLPPLRTSFLFDTCTLYLALQIKLLLADRLGGRSAKLESLNQDRTITSGPPIRAFQPVGCSTLDVGLSPSVDRGDAESRRLFEESESCSRDREWVRESGVIGVLA
jgi:hypothetical protein